MTARADETPAADMLTVKSRWHSSNSVIPHKQLLFWLCNARVRMSITIIFENR